MNREEAISWLTNEKWKNANNKYKKEWNEAFDMAIEALSADRLSGEWIDKGEYAECSLCGAHSGTQFDGVEPIPLKTNYCPNCGARMKTEAEDTQTAERARLVAKETELAHIEAKLENAEKKLDSTKDCTKFLLWLLEEIMDEENWEMNAVADGEVIARKLTNLGLLEVKDGYYVRTSLTHGLQKEERESLINKIKNWKKR